MTQATTNSQPLSNGYYIILDMTERMPHKQIAEHLNGSWYPTACDYDPFDHKQIVVVARIDIEVYTFQLIGDTNDTVNK